MSEPRAESPEKGTERSVEDELAGVQAELKAQREALREQRDALQKQRKQLEAQREELDAQQATGEAEAEEEAQLEALVADVESDSASEQVQAFEPSLDVYGFADTGFYRFWGPGVVEGVTGTDKSTFVLGNVNLYVDAQPFEDWRMLAEVRFSMLPHGTEAVKFDQVGPIYSRDTTVRDPTSPSGGFDSVTLGSIIMERAHIDYGFRDWLSVRAGLFLTPFGIWNVDHGTPTLISANYPQFFVVDMFPQRQIGVELFGHVPVDAWDLAYQLYVSNGRTIGQVDLTEDKALGFRLVARTRRPFRFELGLSGYMGGFEDGFKQPAVDADGLAIRRTFTLEYDEYILGSDVSLDIGDLRLRAEGVMRYVFYEDGKRLARGQRDPMADRVELGLYTVAAYRLPWLGLEPFVELDFVKWPAVVTEALWVPAVGLNVHFNPGTVLKLQYSRVIFFDFRDDLPPAPDTGLNMIVSQLAIAF